jgi:hypothetical protein
MPNPSKQLAVDWPYQKFWQEPRTVGVIDTVHPDEWNSGLITEYLRTHPDDPRLTNVIAIEGNTLGDFERRATGSAPRYYDMPLHKCFGYTGPEISIHSNYEASLTPRILGKVAACEVVFEIHGNEDRLNWSITGPSSTMLAKSIASSVGRFSVMSTDMSLSASCGNVVALDYCKAAFEDDAGGRDKNYINQVLGYITSISHGFTPSLKYHPLYTAKGIDVTVAEARAYDLQKQYAPMQPITDPAVLQLFRDKGISANSVPIVWDEERYGPRGGYVCELVQPVTYEPCTTAFHCIGRMIDKGELDEQHWIPKPPARSSTGAGWPEVAGVQQ